MSNYVLGNSQLLLQVRSSVLDIPELIVYIKKIKINKMTDNYHHTRLFMLKRVFLPKQAYQHFLQASVCLSIFGIHQISEKSVSNRYITNKLLIGALY